MEQIPQCVQLVNPIVVGTLFILKFIGCYLFFQMMIRCSQTVVLLQEKYAQPSQKGEVTLF